MKRKSFIFYESFGNCIKNLPKNIQGEVLMAIVEYGLYGKITNISKTTAAVMELVKPQIKANNQRFKNGCKGGAPMGNLNAKKQPKNNQETTEIQPNNNQKTTKGQPKDNQKQPNENENVNELVKEKTISRDIVEKKFRLSERELHFREKVLQYSEYPTTMLNEFISYWTEPTPGNNKMRFELEKTWDTARRLTTWKKHHDNYEHKRTKPYESKTERIYHEYATAAAELLNNH